MMDEGQRLGNLTALPRVDLAHKPTPLEPMENLSRAGGAELWVKRDDCTGLAFGGNKVRQLEFYLGDALAKGADTVMITGAVQSNFVRLAAAAACRLSMECHVQLEDRVPGVDAVYRNSGNVLLDRMLGAHLHYYEKGEDEAGADERLRAVAAELGRRGRRPYVIPLAPGHPPLGSLGYVVCAAEILAQSQADEAPFDRVVVASGSGHTHAGLLFGLRALGDSTPVTGVCVRRDARTQRGRIRDHCNGIAALLGIESPVSEADIELVDEFLPPGYGRANAPTLDAMALAARREGLVVDTTYTAKAMACLIKLAREAAPGQGARMLFVHTGGQPAIFGSEPGLTRHFRKPA